VSGINRKYSCGGLEVRSERCEVYFGCIEPIVHQVGDLIAREVGRGQPTEDGRLAYGADPRLVSRPTGTVAEKDAATTQTYI
jgi:hypothetical protein